MRLRQRCTRAHAMHRSLPLVIQNAEKPMTVAIRAAHARGQSASGPLRLRIFETLVPPCHIQPTICAKLPTSMQPAQISFTLILRERTPLQHQLRPLDAPRLRARWHRLVVFCLRQPLVFGTTSLTRLHLLTVMNCDGDFNYNECNRFESHQGNHTNSHNLFFSVVLN